MYVGVRGEHVELISNGRLHYFIDLFKVDSKPSLGFERERKSTVYMKFLGCTSMNKAEHYELVDDIQYFKLNWTVHANRIQEDGVIK